MKKYCIICAVIVLVSAFAQPAFAEESHQIPERPDFRLGYYLLEGGASASQMLYSRPEGQNELFDLLLGEWGYANATEKLNSEIWHRYAVQGPDGLYIPCEKHEAYYLDFYYEIWKPLPEKFVIEQFNITKEQFIEANLQLDESIRYTDEEIGLLYGDDYNALYEHFKDPYAYVYNGEIYCLEEALMLDYKLQREMYEKGNFGEYLDGFLTGETLIEEYKLSSFDDVWLEYVSAYLNAGVAPQTGDAVPMLIAATLVSACAVITIKRRKCA